MFGFKSIEELQKLVNEWLARRQDPTSVINNPTTVCSVPGDSQELEMLQASASSLPPGAPQISEA